MAPRKEKSDKTATDQGAALILEYLRKQNRPYSATDISANLHNKVTKANTAKLLKQLHERKEVEERASGKQLVYHIPQPPFNPSDPSSSSPADTLTTLETEIDALRTTLSGLKTREKELRLALSTLSSTLSTDDLRSKAACLEKEKADVMGRLDALRQDEAEKQAGSPPEDQGKGPELTMMAVVADQTELFEAVEKEWKRWKRNASVRKGFVKEMWELAKESGVGVGVASGRGRGEEEEQEQEQERDGDGVVEWESWEDMWDGLGLEGQL